LLKTEWADGQKGGAQMEVIRAVDGRAVFSKEGVGEVYSAESGPMTIEFGRVEQTLDATPLFTGLPDDMCQCDHYGYVIKGTFKFRTKEGEVAFNGGDAFHAAPGHIPLPQAGCEWVTFTRTIEQRRTNAVIAANAQALV
jgi:hypothetical protein